jgi:hypothetical protein
MGVSSSVFAQYGTSDIMRGSSYQWTLSPPHPPLVAHVPVALSQDRHSVMAAGHQFVDMYAKLPFYAKMFADAGFPLTAGQTAVPDALVDSLLVSGNEATVAARFTELLAAGLDELMVSLVPIKDATDEHTQLMHLIGQL